MWDVTKMKLMGTKRLHPPPKINQSINQSKNTNSAIFAFSSSQLHPSLAAEHTNSQWAGVAW